MTFGSLFAGIGGMDLGLERAGMKCVWQVENHDYCQKVLHKNWPTVPKYRDVRYFLGGKRWRRHRAAWYADVICGGFPCQDISNAGRRVGISGSRSGLWSEFARVVRLLRPRYVLVENVAALLGRGMGRVVGDLAQCGYDAEWDCFPAAAFGALHIRNRVFLLAYPNRDDRNGRRGNVQVGRKRSQKAVAEDADDAISGRYRPQKEAVLAGRGGIELSDQWGVEPDVGRVAHGIPFRVERLNGLGNAVVPQVAEWIGRKILEGEQHA